MPREPIVVLGGLHPKQKDRGPWTIRLYELGRSVRVLDVIEDRRWQVIGGFFSFHVVNLTCRGMSCQV